MTCERVQDLLSGRPLRQLSAKDLQRAERHAATCADCRRWLDAEQRLAGALAALNGPGLAASQSDAVLARLAARRTAKPPTARDTIPMPRTGWRRPLELAYAAAGIALVCGAYLSTLAQGRTELDPLAPLVARTFAQPLGALGLTPVTGIIAVGCLVYLRGLLGLADRHASDRAADEVAGA
jgi:predicted anti-sigma-YlaC factor YlaD